MSSLPPAESAPVLIAQLVCRLRAGQVEKFAVSEREVVVGSQPGAGVRIPLDGISRQHCKIVQEGRGWWLEALSDRGGTFLNGAFVVRRERLRHLDVITLGRKVDLVFVVGSGQAVPVGPREGITRAALQLRGGSGIPDEIPLGEVTLGRSTTNSVVVENGAVSKIHARIQRTPRQLIVQDLGSSNGTFVNGARVTTSLLQHGDILSLGDVVEARFEVLIEKGMVDSGEFAAPPLPDLSQAAPAPEVSVEWKTRYDYDSQELANIAVLQRMIQGKRDERRKGAEQKASAKGGHGVAAKAPAAKVAAPKPPAKPPAPRDPTLLKAPDKVAAAAPPAAPAAPGARPSLAEVADAATITPATITPTADTPTADTPTGVSRRARTEPPPAVAAIREVQFRYAGKTLSVSEPGSYLIGRGSDAPLRVQDPTVSRGHARLIIDPARVNAEVEHLGGTNGTKLNGVEVTAPRRLQDGDVIHLGDVKLEVRILR